MIRCTSIIHGKEREGEWERNWTKFHCHNFSFSFDASQQERIKKFFFVFVDRNLGRCRDIGFFVFIPVASIAFKMAILSSNEQSDEERTGSLQSRQKVNNKLEQWWLLTLLTASYVVGELGHFLIGVTSRDVARSIHYGDVACFENATMTATSDDRLSTDGDDEISCSSRRNISRSPHETFPVFL